MEQGEIIIKPKIRVDFSINTPGALIRESLTEIESLGKDIEVRELGPQVMASAMEWAVPTAVAAYLLKPYFEGFLSEAGKDSYKGVKQWAKGFSIRWRSLEVRKVYSSRSEAKQEKSGNTQSMAFSLIFETRNGKAIKLLFDNDLAQDDWDEAVDQLHRLMVENYETYPNDRITTVISQLEQRSSMIFAIIDKDTKQLIFSDFTGKSCTIME